jgi:hypothetical protein
MGAWGGLRADKEWDWEPLRPEGLRLGLCWVAPVVHIPSAYVSSTSRSPCLVLTILLEDFPSCLKVPSGGG